MRGKGYHPAPRELWGYGSWTNPPSPGGATHRVSNPHPPPPPLRPRPPASLQSLTRPAARSLPRAGLGRAVLAGTPSLS